MVCHRPESRAVGEHLRLRLQDTHRDPAGSNRHVIPSNPRANGGLTCLMGI